LRQLSTARPAARSSAMLKMKRPLCAPGYTREKRSCTLQIEH
jgi:hypothetical protein